MQEILVVDVREPDEVALGTIPSAVSLPLSQLRDALDKNYSPGEFQKVSLAHANSNRPVMLISRAEVCLPQAFAFAEHHLLLPVGQAVGDGVRVGRRAGI